MKKIYVLLIFLFIFFVLTGHSQTVKILFDASSAETAGNADWVIDADAHNLGFGSGPATLNGGNESNAQKIPTPAQSGITASTSETYWNGALSYWGIDCVNHNYVVETLPYNGLITYGNNSNSQDLSNYKVFIVCEPNIVFTAAEKTAILTFVQNGGGLFMISDHDVSDRNNDNWDSPHIWNDLMTNNTVQVNPFGMTFDYANISQTSSNIPSLPTDSILHGVAGNVTQVQWSNGTTLTLSPAQNSSVKGVVYKTSSAFGNNNVMCAYARYGNGKVAAIGDSSPCDDGSGDSNDNLFDGYISDAGGNHRKLLMNITIWLATPNTSVPPVANFSANPLTVCVGQSTTFTNSSSAGVTGYSWNFGSGATPSTANTVGPHSVTYSTGGSKTISLTVTNSAGNNTATKTNYIYVDPNCQPSDLGALSLLNPPLVNCPVQNKILQVRIKNYGANTIDFSVNPLDVVIQITDPASSVQSFTKTVNTGTLGGGANKDITFDNTFDLDVSGNYIFNAYTVFPSDINSANNSMPATTVTVNPGFGSNYTVVDESMGTVSTTTSISSHESSGGFDNDGLTMTGTADVRATQTSASAYPGASGGANVFFTNTVGRFFNISGINTSANNNLQLAFGFYKTLYNSSDFLVQVSTDGTNYIPLTMPAIPATAGWYYINVSGSIPNVPNLRIQFVQNNSTNQFRVDDISLYDSIVEPTISTLSPDTFCEGGSAVLNASFASSYLWSNGSTTQSITVNQSGSYYVTSSNASGCSATSSEMVITVNPKYNYTVNVTICQGSSYVLPNGTIVSTSGNYTSTLQSVASCDSIINTNLTVLQTDDNNFCTTDACNSITGIVTHTTVNTNDNNACTTDACNSLNGIITHTSINISDGNTCTTDACNSSNGVVTNIPVDINDNDACTSDACNSVNGNITHTLININDGNACTTDACNSSTGNITHDNVNTDDGNACTTDACDQLTGVISHLFINIDDNNICTTDECNSISGNISHVIKNVDDGNECTTDGCDSSTGIFHNSVVIDDGNLCTDDICNSISGIISHIEINFDDNNSCTIDGCNSITGIFHNPAIEICGNGIDDNCDGRIDEGCSLTLNIKVFIEGYYRGSNLMIAVADPILHPDVCDTITTEIHSAVSPFNLISAVKNTIDVSGNGHFIFPSLSLNQNYYIVIRHRNSIETWSNAVNFSSSVMNYDFSVSINKAYGNSLKDLSDGNFALLSGDIDQNGIIDFNDVLGIENMAELFVSGYTNGDLTGDGLVEASDYSLVENNLNRLLSRP